MYQTKFKRPLLALLVALAGLLMGCQSRPEYVRELPPQELLQPCPYVAERVSTNGGLAWTILEYRKALAMCNADKAALRLWADTP